MPSLSTAAARASTPPSPIPTPPPAAATPSSGIPHLSSLLSTNPERLSFGLWVLGLCGDSGCRKTGNWGCRCRLELFVRRSGARWCLDLDIMGFEKMTFRRPEQATKNSKDTDNIMVQAIVFENCIALVIALGMFEMALWYFEYAEFNETRLRPMGITFWAVTFGTVKRTVSRVIILVVSMGYGVVRPTLGSLTSKVIMLGATFFLASEKLELVENVGKTVDG
ncbi:hypothetical protein BHE74_00037417 [Ensete ventricosum]|nr:hypothetical protein BHE74_00037417 [Ensete ventricosum]